MTNYIGTTFINTITKRTQNMKSKHFYIPYFRWNSYVNMEKNSVGKILLRKLNFKIIYYDKNNSRKPIAPDIYPRTCTHVHI